MFKIEEFLKLSENFPKEDPRTLEQLNDRRRIAFELSPESKRIDVSRIDRENRTAFDLTIAKLDVARREASSSAHSEARRLELAEDCATFAAERFHLECTAFNPLIMRLFSVFQPLYAVEVPMVIAYRINVFYHKLVQCFSDSACACVPTIAVPELPRTTGRPPVPTVLPP